MVMIKAKGNEFNLPNVKDSFNRRAAQFRQSIMDNLKNNELAEGYIEVSEQAYALKKAKASALWYFNGHRLYYSYNLCNTFVENMYVVMKVIELEVKKLINEEKTLEEFTHEFKEDKEVEDKRKEARKILGLDENETDVEVINRAYKNLAKEHHPDTGAGNIDKFKEINNAHKTLKRELE